MRTRMKGFLVSAVVIILAIQVIRPTRSNPAVEPERRIDAVVAVDPVVGKVLQRSCSDCHSNATRWPWYSHVAPVSWLVASDVNRGRRALNLSQWADYPPEQQAELLEHVCEETMKGEMPQMPYSVMHPGAWLNLSDRRLLCDWTQHAGGGRSE